MKNKKSMYYNGLIAIKKIKVVFVKYKHVLRFIYICLLFNVFNYNINIYAADYSSMSCEEFDFSFEIQHLICETNTNGKINVILPDGVEILNYTWSNGAGTLNQTGLDEGEYQLDITILDKFGRTCTKSKIANIRSSIYVIKVSTDPVTGCNSNDGQAHIEKVLKYPELTKQFQCSNEVFKSQIEFTQPNPIFLIGENDTVINAGMEVFIDTGFVYNGNIQMNGGKLYVFGGVMNKSISISGGEVIIAETGDLVTDELSLEGSAMINNFNNISTIKATISSNLTNYNSFSADSLLIEPNGLITNYKNLSPVNLINSGTIINYNSFMIDGFFFNALNSSLINYCHTMGERSIINYGTIENEGFLYAYDTLTNIGNINIYNNSECLINYLVNSGNITARGNDCFCFNAKENVILQDNSVIHGIYDGCNQNVQCDCYDVIDVTDKAVWVESGTRTLSGLKPGEHEDLISIGGCIQEEEYYISGGLEVEMYEDPEICAGNATLIGAKITYGDGLTSLFLPPPTIQWSPTNSLYQYDEIPALQNSIEQIAIPDHTTTYSITVSYLNCTKTGSMTVNVLPPPPISISNDTAICYGEPVTLSSGLTGDYNFKWAPDTWLDDATSSDPVSTPEENIKYYLLAENATTGCFAIDSVEITVNPVPNVEVTQSSENMCKGESILFTPSGAESYTWSPDTDLEYLSDGTVRATPDETTTYSITGENAFGCSNTVEASAGVYPLQDVATAINPTPCIGNDIQLYVTGSGSDYHWEPAEYLDDPNSASPIASLSNPKTFYVTVTDHNGCTYERDIFVDPVKWPDAGPDVPVCYGEPAQLNATGGVSGSYHWEPATGLSDPNIPNPVANISSGMEYTVTARNQYDCENSDKVSVFIDPSCRCSNFTTGITYEWEGDVDNEWKNPQNWNTGDPANDTYPGTSLDDNVLIAFDETTKPVPVLPEDITIANICMLSGELDLSTYSLIVTKDATFTGGTVESSGRDTANAMKVIQPDDATGNSSVFFAGTEFNSGLLVSNASEIVLNGSVFNGVTVLQQTGDNDVLCAGGNTYNGPVSFINTGNAQWSLAAANTGQPDIYNDFASFENTGSGNLYPSAYHTDEYNGNIEINSDIIFGINGGIVRLSGEPDQHIGGTNTDGANIIRKLEISKVHTFSHSNVYLTVPLSIGTNNEDYIMFENGIVYNDDNSILTIKLDTEVSGASDSSYVNGPVTKIGNHDFVFPVGKDRFYKPISISKASTINESIEYTAEFIADEQSYGTPQAPVEHVSECEYWTLRKNVADGILVNIGLSWNRHSCDIPVDLSEMEVASWDVQGLKWESLGQQIYHGSRETGGMFTSEIKAVDYEAFIIASKCPGAGDPIGLTFNNFGTEINIGENTYLTVQGNILNEYGRETEKKGAFFNKGEIRLTRDWTNNVDNEAFALSEGKVIMIGNYQRFRGDEETTFHELITAGTDTKEMFKNVKVDGILDLNVNRVETNTNILHVLNDDNTSIKRIEGFVSTSDTGGFLARDLNLTPDTPYEFPVGELYRYRPVTVTQLENKAASAPLDPHTYYVSMISKDPNYFGFNRSVREPTVKSVNPEYFHMIRRDDGTASEITKDSVQLDFYFNRQQDNTWQSVGHWDNEPEDSIKVFDYGSDIAPIWKKTRPVYALEGDSTIPDIISITPWADFNQQAFAFIKGAFIVNTLSLVSPTGPGGVTYALTGSTAVPGEPYHTSGNNSTKLGEPMAPEMLEACHYLEVYEDATTKYGKIKFCTDGNGDIIPLSDPPGYYKVYFIVESEDGTEEEHLIDKDLYDVYRDILKFKAEPENEITCQNNIKVSFSNGDPFVLSLSNPRFSITYDDNDETTTPDQETVFPDDSVNYLKVFKNSTEVCEIMNNIPQWNTSEIDETGIYTFEIQFVTETGTSIYKGQFIVKE